MEDTLKTQIFRIYDLNQILVRNQELLQRAIEKNHPNEKKAQELKVAMLKKNIVNKVKLLRSRVCGQVWHIDYLVDGRLEEAVLTNLDKEDIPDVFKLQYGQNYDKVKILEIKEIPTYIKKG